MKNIKLSLIVALAILGASVTAFTGKRNITAGWYGQPSDAVPPYNLTYPISASQAYANCPTGTQHICAVELDQNGNLVATLKSANNFKP